MPAPRPIAGRYEVLGVEHQIFDHGNIEPLRVDQVCGCDHPEVLAACYRVLIRGGQLGLAGCDHGPVDERVYAG